ncbi:MAG: hypothetical protein ABI193_15430 [Minicystis sp.]
MKLDLPPSFTERWEQRFAHLSREELLVGAGIFVASIVGSALLAIVVLTRLPPDYLRRDRPSLSRAPRPRWKQIPITVGKNLLGVLLIVAGVVMSVPGVPGQGLLTIVIGVMLLDFPGKPALERKLMMRPSVFKNINKLRVRFKKEPLLPAEDA